MESQAKPQRLYLMQVASLPSMGNTPIVCYLIQMDDGTNILIDSGLAPNTPPPPGREPPAMGDDVIVQLARIGLKPDDIRYFICTHFDPDHAGNNDRFPNAEFIVQKRHYELAQTSPRLARSRDHWDQPSLHYRYVDGDTTLVPGVELIATDGHVTGHQSVLVRLPEIGAVLLAIDAVTQESRFNENVEASPMDEDEGALRVSVHKLKEIAGREHAALVIFGHDGAQWGTLNKLPTPYC